MFYVKNLLLNWNVIAVAAAVAPLVALVYLIVGSKQKRAAGWMMLKWLSGGMLWMVVMFMQPHKEERFLYPVYHLIVLAGTFTLCELNAFVFSYSRPTAKQDLPAPTPFAACLDSDTDDDDEEEVEKAAQKAAAAAAPKK